jgi:hypothetical protein
VRSTRLAKDRVPSLIAIFFEALVNNIGGKYCIADELSEALKLSWVRTDALPQIGELAFHEKLPGYVNGLFLRNALVSVALGKRILLLDELRIRHARVVNIVNQCAENNSKLQQVEKVQSMSDIFGGRR